MGSVVSICKASNSDVLVAPPIVLSQQAPQDTGKNHSLDNYVGKETETQHSPEELEHKPVDELVLSAQKKSTRPHGRKSVGSERRLEGTKNFPDKEITINLKIFDSQANIDRRDLRKKRRENRLHKNKNRIHSALILPLKSHNKPQKAGYPRQQQEQKRQDFIETSSAEDISVCRLKSYLLDQNSTFLTTLNRPSTSCTESNMSRVPTSTKLLKKRQSSASSKVFDGLYSQVSDTSTLKTLSTIEKSERTSESDEDKDKKNHLAVEKSQGPLSELEHIDSLKSSAQKLQDIQEALNGPKEDFFKKITRKDLRHNVDFVIKVLENCLENERKRIISDDDAISEMEQQDLVSPEVKSWLSMTFTRSVSQKREVEKPKFKSVANAIRAGIMVDRMFRRMSSSLETIAPVPVDKIMKTINEWNFEIFQMNEVSDNHSLRYIGFELMQKFNILNRFKIQNLVMQNFLEAIEVGYSKYNNPYHNLIHAADVLQTQYNLLNNAGLLSWLTPLETFAVFISAIVHDFEHTGTTNNFHIQTRSDISLIYNDRAVLENYHISTTFRLFKEDGYNILSGLTRDEYKEFRNLCIEMVLATDMSFHFTQIKTIKNTMSLNEKLDKSKALSLILHCADISHPAKTWHLHEVWTNSLVEEFFAQGDREKALGLPYSPLCDRNNTPIAQSQIGFINFIVEPSMVVMGDMIDRLADQILREFNPDLKRPITPKLCDRPWVTSLSENKAKWTDLAEVDKKKKEAAEAEAAAKKEKEEAECDDNAKAESSGKN